MGSLQRRLAKRCGSPLLPGRSCLRRRQVSPASFGPLPAPPELGQPPKHRRPDAATPRASPTHFRDRRKTPQRRFAVFFKSWIQHLPRFRFCASACACMSFCGCYFPSPGCVAVLRQRRLRLSIQHALFARRPAQSRTCTFNPRAPTADLPSDHPATLLQHPPECNTTSGLPRITHITSSTATPLHGRFRNQLARRIMQVVS